MKKNQIKRQFITYKYQGDGIFLVWQAGSSMMIDGSTFSVEVGRWIRICVVSIMPKGPEIDQEINTQIQKCRDLLNQVVQKSLRDDHGVFDDIVTKEEPQASDSSG